MRFELPWATLYSYFIALGLAWLISSFQMSKISLLVFAGKVFVDDISDDEEKGQEDQVWTWDLGWKGEADEGPCLHHDPHSHVGASESPAKTLGFAVQCDHKSGDKRVVTIHADEWRMPWARLPRAQVPSTDAPQVSGLAPLAALTFAGRLGVLWGHSLQESRSCCSSVFCLKVPLGASSSPSAGPSSALPTPQRQQAASLVHHQLQREVGAAPPSPVLGSWEQSEGDTGALSLCRQGVTWKLCIPVGACWDLH